MDDACEKPGNVVLLNGTSSAGKTTIAKSLQQVMEMPYLHTGKDHFMRRFPARFTTISDGQHPATSDYFLMIYDGDTTCMQAESEGGEVAYALGRLVGVRVGPLGLKLLAGMYHSVAALSAAGIDVIVDDVIYDPRMLAAAVHVLRETPVLFVGLRLPLGVAEQRERDRGNRGPGGAAAFYDLVHAHGLYDLELDTSLLDPVACALRIKTRLEAGPPPTAFRKLAVQLVV